MDDSKEKFAEYVSSLPTGSVEKNKTLIGFLELIWDSLSGSSNQNTTANKLDRIENIFWSPPLLEFILERHGPTVNGSSRANLHYWRVNINDWSAEIYKTGKKQLTPMSRKYYASIDAEAVAQLLIQGKYKDPRLEIKSDGNIRVLITKIVPNGGAKLTTIARHKKFRQKLSEILIPHGWVEITPHFWRPPKHNPT